MEHVFSFFPLLLLMLFCFSSFFLTAKLKNEKKWKMGVVLQKKWNEIFLKKDEKWNGFQ
jgi:uncharacterized membrane protein